MNISTILSAATGRAAVQVLEQYAQELGDCLDLVKAETDAVIETRQRIKHQLVTIDMKIAELTSANCDLLVKSTSGDKGDAVSYYKALANYRQLLLDEHAAALQNTSKVRQMSKKFTTDLQKLTTDLQLAAVHLQEAKQAVVYTR